jgi:large subunit ribosomal protein L18
MADIKNKKERRIMRHVRVRKNVFGTAERPRLVIFKSLKHLYAQIVDDEKGVTITGVSTLSPEFREKCANMSRTQMAEVVGKAVSQKIREREIQSVVFDRNGYKYHGVVKTLAEAVRAEKLLV